jgi:DNA/RNA non-specific endonuclease
MTTGKSEFEVYLRTGIRARPEIERKFNPWHDPEDGRFTFVGQGQFYGGQSWTGGSFSGGGGGDFGGGGADSDEPWPDPKRAPRRQKIEKRPSPRIIRTVRAAPRRKPKKRPRLTRHTANGYHFDVDDRRRTHRAEGALTLADAGRAPNTQKEAGKPDRLDDDDGGHFIAARFNGPREELNHFAQNANFNRGAYRALEDQWARALKRGERVLVRIRVRYTTGSRRPDFLLVRYFINGGWRRQLFPNRRGGK